MIRQKIKSKQIRPDSAKYQALYSGKRTQALKVNDKLQESPLRPSSQDYHTSLRNHLLNKNYLIVRNNLSSQKKKQKPKTVSVKAKNNGFLLYPHNRDHIQIQNQKDSRQKQKSKQKIKKQNAKHKKQSGYSNHKQFGGEVFTKTLGRQRQSTHLVPLRQKQRHHGHNGHKESKPKNPSFKCFIGTKLRKKLQAYLLFISLINYSLRIKYKAPNSASNIQKRYTVYIGKGNNSKLIKKAFSNRFWWNIVTTKCDMIEGKNRNSKGKENIKQKQKQINLVWTQLSKSNVFNAISSIKQQTMINKSQQHQNHLLKSEQNVQMIHSHNFNASNAQLQKNQQQNEIFPAIKDNKIKNRSAGVKSKEAFLKKLGLINKSTVNNINITDNVYSQIQNIYDLFQQSDKHHLLSKITKKDQSQQSTKYESIKELLSIKQQKKSYTKLSIPLTHNHIQNHHQFTNKKNLFFNLKAYYGDKVWDIVPLTFHVSSIEGYNNQIEKNQSMKINENQKEALSEQQYEEEGDKQQNDGDCSNSLNYVLSQIEEYSSETKNNNNQDRKDKEKEKEKDKSTTLWIVKPGQNSNRGCGIEVFKKAQQIRAHILKQKQKHPQRTFIIQKYINPFLYHRRKFDIRCYLLVTTTPSIRAYYYPIGYIRTSSHQFSFKNCTNKFIHLTNDAIQKKNKDDYGKFQKGNKLTYEEFQSYLDLFEAKKQLNFNKEILHKIQEMILKTVKVMAQQNQNNAKINNKRRVLNPQNRQHSFQLYGFDFMIDQQFKPWLIQINTNPCLQTGCEILQGIIPPMIQNMVKICVDTVFTPPKLQDWPLNYILTCPDELSQANLFKLIYSEINQKKK